MYFEVIDTCFTGGLLNQCRDSFVLWGRRLVCAGAYNKSNEGAFSKHGKQLPEYVLERLIARAIVEEYAQTPAGYGLAKVLDLPAGHQMLESHSIVRLFFVLPRPDDVLDAGVGNTERQGAVVVMNIDFHYVILSLSY